MMLTLAKANPEGVSTLSEPAFSPVDRRREPRLACRHLSVFSHGSASMAVDVRNISRLGVGLQAQDPLPERGWLQLFLPGQAFSVGLVRVYQRRLVDGWSAGFAIQEGSGGPALERYLTYIGSRSH
ncbi:MAG TPA: PilZ domain-containing protein [Candidatus Nitrosotenuis sp.]|jgi:hypothetical protein|nr:PilZ domain-containing protein [Candidatus Nitrosotenuis sp.]